jgi:hypothetical protein
MIAQKVVDTKQPKQPESAFVTLPDLVAAAFRTFSHTDISFKKYPPTKCKPPSGANEPSGV